MIINGVNVTERGWAGHFICADKCKFRRNTLLEYKGKKWIVSTVGAMINPLTNKIETIGYARWYETMAFVGGEKNGYIDADVSQQIYFDSDWGIWGESWNEIFENCNHTPDNAANDMHERIVSELIEKIRQD